MPEHVHEHLELSLSVVETASYESLQLVDKEYAQWIVSYVLAGSVTMSCRRQSWQLRAGDVMVHAPHLPFSEIASGPGTHQWCLFTMTRVPNLDLFHQYPVAPVVTIAPSSHFSRHFCALEQLWKGPETPLRDLQASVLAWQLCSIVLECWHQAGSIPRPTALQTPSPRFSAVIQYITEHLEEKISRDDLAALVHLHPGYFDQAFQQIYGISPMQMVRDLRLRQGLRLLERTDMPLSAIAYACGLGDAGYFSRVFHQRYNQTPGQYRQRIQRAMIDYVPPDVDFVTG